jgi:hypothetical protein
VDSRTGAAGGCHRAAVAFAPACGAPLIRPVGHLPPQGEKAPAESSRLDHLLPLREKVPEGRMRGVAARPNLSALVEQHLVRVLVLGEAHFRLRLLDRQRALHRRAGFHALAPGGEVRHRGGVDAIALPTARPVEDGDVGDGEIARHIVLAEVGLAGQLLVENAE